MRPWQSALFITIVVGAVMLACALCGSKAYACDKNPVAIAYDHACAVVGNTVYFDGGASYDPDNPHPQTDGITKWEWAFGDGKTHSGETASHAYDAPATYTVTLKVTDDDYTQSGGTQPNKTDTDTVTVCVIGLEFDEDSGHRPTIECYKPGQPPGWVKQYKEVGGEFQGGEYGDADIVEDCEDHGVEAYLKLSMTTYGDHFEDDYGVGSRIQPSGDLLHKIYLKGGSGNCWVYLEGIWMASGNYTPDKPAMPDGILGAGGSSITLGSSKGEFMVRRPPPDGPVQIGPPEGPNPVVWSGQPSGRQQIGTIYAWVAFSDNGAVVGNIWAEMYVFFNLSVWQ